jgi:septal ring factor EnvC (AmiA/AmiB activator)
MLLAIAFDGSLLRIVLEMLQSTQVFYGLMSVCLGFLFRGMVIKVRDEAKRRGLAEADYDITLLEKRKTELVDEIRKLTETRIRELEERLDLVESENEHLHRRVANQNRRIGLLESELRKHNLPVPASEEAI